jgi:hypothetical protein
MGYKTKKAAFSYQLSAVSLEQCIKTCFDTHDIYKKVPLQIAEGLVIYVAKNEGLTATKIHSIQS